MNRLALLLGFAACDGSSMSTVDAPSPDTGGMHATCTQPLPALDAPWLASELHASLAALAAAPRATATQRDTARGLLVDRLTALGLSPHLEPYSGGENVVATVPSTTGGDHWIVVGAHFDSVAGSPGANDNASGSAVVLALAHYLAETECRVPNVILALFDQEESGLFGSNAMAARLVADHTIVDAVHTVDQVAWDADHDRVIELEQPTAALAMAYLSAAEAVPEITLSVVQTGGTDHVAFRDRGFAAIGVTEEYAGGDTSPYRHTPDDTTDTVDETYLQLAAKLVARVVIDATQ